MTPLTVAPRTVGDLLEEARASLSRVLPVDAARRIDAGALLVDIRPESQRRAEGGLVGALVIERNVLEWRLDPSSPDRIPEITGHDQEIIVACSAGYASSFAAASLQQLGFSSATDLVGGFQAWQAAGLPTTPGTA
jgi:rhodanese-related sulfurtransferase